MPSTETMNRTDKFPLSIKITALLPMKGASERVPEKNTRLFNGEPLCCKILATLQRCDSIFKIIVNTDSEKIATLASRYSKVTIHERPKPLCGHHISMNDIIQWDLKQDDNTCEHYLQTHVTNPLLTEETISRAIVAYFENMAKHDALFSVTPLQIRLYTQDGKGLNHDPVNLLNTQDLPVLYEENSCIYIFSRKSFALSGRRTGASPLMFPISKYEAFDIDTEEDFRIAEAAWILQES